MDIDEPTESISTQAEAFTKNASPAVHRRVLVLRPAPPRHTPYPAPTRNPITSSQPEPSASPSAQPKHRRTTNLVIRSRTAPPRLPQTRSKRRLPRRTLQPRVTTSPSPPFSPTPPPTPTPVPIGSTAQIVLPTHWHLPGSTKLGSSLDFCVVKTLLDCTCFCAVQLAGILSTYSIFVDSDEHALPLFTRGKVRRCRGLWDVDLLIAELDEADEWYEGTELVWPCEVSGVMMSRGHWRWRVRMSLEKVREEWQLLWKMNYYRSVMWERAGLRRPGWLGEVERTLELVKRRVEELKAGEEE